MSWGNELWDRLDHIQLYTEEGFQFIEKSRNMFVQLSQVEMEYAKNIRKVVKSNVSADVDNSTLAQAWKAMLQSFDEIAGFHEKAASTLANDVNNSLKNLVKSKAGERADIMRNIQQLQSQVAASLDTLEKARRKHEKIYREAESAKAAYDKVDRADNATRAKVEKARKAWAEKAKASDASELTLKQVTEDVNNTRTVHYRTHMPEQFNQLQALNENRGEAVAQSFIQVAMLLKDRLNNSLAAVTAFEETARQHSKENDSALFAQLHRSGEGFPGNLPVPLPQQQGQSQPSPRAARPNRASAAEPRQYADEEEEDIHETSQASLNVAAAPPQPTMQCRSLYDFPGTNPGELPCTENEILGVVSDDGSGWVLCEKLSNRQQGYVPHSYLQF